MSPESNDNPHSDNSLPVIYISGDLCAAAGFIDACFAADQLANEERAITDEELDRLVAMGPLAYEAIRKDMALAIGIRTKALDALVSARRKEAKQQQKIESQTQPVAPGRKSIQVQGGSLADNAIEAEEHLVDIGYPIYQRGEQLLRPIIANVEASGKRKTQTAALLGVTDVYMRTVLCHEIDWFRFDERQQKLVEINPPMDVARTIVNRAGDWTFPTVSGIVSTPTLRRDGSILTKPGYDPETGLILFNPPPMPDIPAEPTRQDAVQALALLLDLTREFRYEDDASKSVALSAIITPCARPAMNLVPMHVFSAPMPGSGKSYCVDLPSTIYSGAPCPVIGKGETLGELEKRLNTSLVAGHPLVSIDNVNGELGGDALCHAVERELIDIRLLGATRHVRVRNTATLYATGNNIRLVGDVVRRALLCRIDPKEERPELIEYKGNPIGDVLADRGKYIAACLTIVRAYIVAGKPNKPPHLGSFEEWSDLIRGALIWLGHADPVKTMDKARSDDPEVQGIAQIFHALAETFGVGPQHARLAKDILDTANGIKDEYGRIHIEDSRLKVALTAMHDVKRGPIDARALGRWLSDKEGRQVNGLTLRKIANDKVGHRWYMEKV